MNDKRGRDIETMASPFDSRAKAYRLITDAERLVPVALAGKRFVAFPIGIRFSVDGDDNRR